MGYQQTSPEHPQYAAQQYQQPLPQHQHQQASVARAIIPTTAATDRAAAPTRAAVTVAVSKPKQSFGSAGTKSKSAKMSHKPRARAPKGTSSKSKAAAEKKAQRVNMDRNAAPSFGAVELFIGDDDALSLVASSVASGGSTRTTHTSTAGKAPIKERKRKRSESKSGVAMVPKAKRDVPKLNKPDLFEAEKPAGSRNPGNVQLRFQEEFNNLLIVHGMKKYDDETTKILESIVRLQVIETTKLASESTRERGARNLTTDDLLFACRRNKVTLHRLADFVTAKESQKRALGRPTQANRVGMQQKSKWLLQSSLNEVTPDFTIPFASPQLEASIIEIDGNVTNQLTKNVDQSTDKNYVGKGCNFTFKKTRKFREWVDLTSITEFKGNDEFYEVLGYITTMITVEMLGLAKKTSPGSGTMVRGEHFIELLRRLGGRSTVLY